MSRKSRPLVAHSVFANQPQGVLPYWLLVTAAASVYNVAQNYVTLKQSKEVYGGRPDEGECAAAINPSDPPCWPPVRRVDRHGRCGAPARCLQHQQPRVSPRASQPNSACTTSRSARSASRRFTSPPSGSSSGPSSSTARALAPSSLAVSTRVPLTTASGVVWMLTQRSYYLA